LEKRALTAKLRCNAQRGAEAKSQKMSVRPGGRSEMAERPAREAAFAGRRERQISRGVVHRTRAPVRTAILMVERAGVVPTGD